MYKLFIPVVAVFLILVVPGCDNLFGGSSDTDTEPQVPDEPQVTPTFETRLAFGDEVTVDYPGSNGPADAVLFEIDTENKVTLFFFAETEAGIVQEFGLRGNATSRTTTRIDVALEEEWQDGDKSWHHLETEDIPESLTLPIENGKPFMSPTPDDLSPPEAERTYLSAVTFGRPEGLVGEWWFEVTPMSILGGSVVGPAEVVEDPEPDLTLDADGSMSYVLDSQTGSGIWWASGTTEGWIRQRYTEIDGVAQNWEHINPYKLEGSNLIIYSDLAKTPADAYEYAPPGGNGLE